MTEQQTPPSLAVLPAQSPDKKTEYYSLSPFAYSCLLALLSCFFSSLVAAARSIGRFLYQCATARRDVSQDVSKVESVDR